MYPMQRDRREFWLSIALTLLAVAAIVAGLAHAVASLNSAAAAKAPAVAAAAAAAQLHATPTQDPWSTKGLSVQGTQILDARGKPLILAGAARYSLEYSCQGDGHFQLTDFQAMRRWGMNVVRLPLSSAYWRNLNGACPTYQATVTAAVASAEEAGLYVILDLQRDAPFNQPQDALNGGAQCPLPDATSDLSFWQDLAAIYASDPRVLFDLFGEPHDIDWDAWAHGGPITSACFAYGTPLTYRAIGMPALATAVRAIAPRNIIILSGIGWGYDLSNLTALGVAARTNVVFATHPWDHQGAQQPADWSRAFGATAKQLPVIAAEFGAYDCQTGYIATAFTYFAQLHMSFLAWTWATGNCGVPGLIVNWSGSPTKPYGQFIQQQMLQVAAQEPSA